MNWKRYAFTILVFVCVSTSIATGQTSQQATPQQKIAALEKEVQSLKAQIAALRAQSNRKWSPDAQSRSDRSSSHIENRPSKEEIYSCTQSSGQFVSSDIVTVEFANTITSQGSSGQPGAGTKLFPVKISFVGGYVEKGLIYRDPFGKVQCQRMQD